MRVKDTGAYKALDRCTRPERSGGNGWKVAVGFLAAWAFMGLTDVMVIDHEHVTEVYDAVLVVLGAVGGISGVVTIVRTILARRSR